MEVSQETILHRNGKTPSTDISDSTDDVFWDAHWTLDDDEQTPEPTTLALL